MNINQKNIELLKEKNVPHIDLGQYSTDGIADLSNLFVNCDMLEHIDLFGFQTSEVEIMDSMFEGCSSLKDIDMSWFRADNCVTMRRMFFGCESLKRLDISNFETSNIENLESMFEGCTSLETIDFSGNNIKDWANTNKMFVGCTNLREIIMHGCSKQTIANLIMEYFITFRRLIKFTTDDIERNVGELKLHCPVCNKIATIEFTCPGNNRKFLDTCHLFAYGQKCLDNVFGELLTAGNEILLVVRYPLYCKVGEYFNIVNDEHLKGRGYKLGFTTFQLLEIIVQLGSCAIVRCEVIKTGTYFDFVQKCPSVPTHYTYYYPEGDAINGMIRYRDEKEGILIAWNTYGGGDINTAHHIITINGVDHLVALEYNDFDQDMVAFGDLVLGMHDQCPYNGIEE